VINIDGLAPGAHTVTVTSTDMLGNSTVTTLTFTIHATISGLIAAVNDGAAHGYVTAAEQSSLLGQLRLAQNGNPKPKLQGFVSMVQSAGTAKITAAYASLLVAWTNDLIARS